MNSLQFKSTLATMRAGEKVVYFTGSLAFARYYNKEVDRLADTVWKLAGMRWVPNARPTANKEHVDQWLPIGERRIALTQRRLSEPMGYEYIVTKL